MTHEQLFELISSALSGVDLDLEQDRDKRIYVAYLASRIGQGDDGALERRLAQMRKELSL
jgi:uncharacterized protein (DUF1499 family)